MVVYHHAVLISTYPNFTVTLPYSTSLVPILLHLSLGFMIQTGDPLGDGTGGESIWGGEREGESGKEGRN